MRQRVQGRVRFRAVHRSALPIAAVALAACGAHTANRLSLSEQRKLPLVVGDLNELCTKLPSEWRSASYQRTRRARLRQADALISALRHSPDARVRARFIAADSGRQVSVSWNVRRLAAEQLADFDAARYCTRPGTPTSGDAAHAALVRIATLRRHVHR